MASLLLCAASGCASLGDSICERETEIAAAVADAGAYFGAPGVVVARILNLALTIGCGAITAPIYGTHAIAAAVGITTPRGDHAVSQPTSRPAQ